MKMDEPAKWIDPVPVQEPQQHGMAEREDQTFMDWLRRKYGRDRTEPQHNEKEKAEEL